MTGEKIAEKVLAEKFERGSQQAKAATQRYHR